MFHVRPVTQGDVIRADPKEIPRIFQLLYAGEGEARRPDEQQQLDVSSSKADERPMTLQYKGEFFHSPSPFPRSAKSHIEVNNISLISPESTVLPSSLRKGYKITRKMNFLI